MPGVLGRRVLRVEDQRLLTAGGTYVADLRVPELAGAAQVTFVRSPIAHATVLLPTPPLPEATEMMCLTPGSGSLGRPCRRGGPSL